MEIKFQVGSPGSRWSSVRSWKSRIMVVLLTISSFVQIKRKIIQGRHGRPSSTQMVLKISRTRSADQNPETLVNGYRSSKLKLRSVKKSLRELTAQAGSNEQRKLILLTFEKLWLITISWRSGSWQSSLKVRTCKRLLFLLWLMFLKKYTEKM